MARCKKRNNSKKSCWKKQKVAPNRILWTKGKFKPGKGYRDWVHVDDNRDFTPLDKNDNFEVGVKKEKINPETINGHFKDFKTKKQALKLANKYMEDNPC